MNDLDFSALMGNSSNDHENMPSHQKEQVKPLINHEFDIQREHQRMVEIFDEYQINIQKSEMYLNKIMLGLRNHDDIVTLLSYAVKAIARMANDKAFEEQALEIIRQSYSKEIVEKDVSKTNGQ